MSHKKIILELEWTDTVVDWGIESFVLHHWYKFKLTDDEGNEVDNTVTVIDFAETILINIFKRDMVARDVRVAKKEAEINAKATSEASFEQLDISIKEE